MTGNNDSNDEVDEHEPYLSPPDTREKNHPNVERTFRSDVSIRSRDTGIIMYAVYDGDTQVSKETGPLNERELIGFAEGYAHDKSED